MKLLKRYKNKQNNITYNLYRLNNGVPLIYLKNPISIDFDIALVHRAGTVYENIEKVPKGTAHMLEHILFRPSKRFKTDEEIYQFEAGNRNHPAIYMNGHTGNKYLSLIGSTNQEGTTRLLERLASITEFSEIDFKRSFDTEKDIVLAEQSREIPTKKNKFLQYFKFLEEDVFPEFVYPIIGEAEDIKKITLKDVKKYFDARFTKNDLVITVQSSQLKKEHIAKLEEITNKYSDMTTKQLDTRVLMNKLDYGSFNDERLTGTAISFGYFEKDNAKFDYKYDAINNILARLIRKVGEQSLRDKKGFIYSIALESATFLSFGYILKEIAIVVENSKINSFLEAFDFFLFSELEDFLNSPKGDEWFEHNLSTLMYPHTPQFDDNLAEHSGSLFMEKNDLFNSNKYREAIKSVKKRDVLAKIKDIQSIPPHIWVESNLDKKEVEKSIKESSLWKRYTK